MAWNRTTLRASVGPSIRLAALFVLLAGVPLAALGLLGWRLLSQDRALERQRLRDQMENAATLVGREVDRSLASWEEILPTSATPGADVAVPPHAALMVLDARGLRTHLGVPLPYFPAVSAPPEVATNVFAAAEAEEFRDGNLARAVDTYRRLSRNADRGTRAAALMRLARVLRRQRQFNEALAVYTELAAMGATPVAGSPAELLARHERVALLKTLSDQAAAAREQAVLASVLLEGRFPIDRPTFDFFSESIGPSPASTEGADLARAVEALWPLWQQQPAGRTGWTSETGGGFVAVWRQLPGGTAVLVGPIDALLAQSLPVIDALHVQMTLNDEAGRPSWGTAAAGGVALTRTFRETGLPWTMGVSPSDPDAASRASDDRRRLWLAGFGLMILVIAVAGYLVVRSVNRELAVVRLQSDFVDTVSHEFRTPLTAMRHLTEMLEEGSASADRLPEYFRALGKETRRLQDMVESLLDFGRLESGRRTYLMEEMSAVALATAVVDEFRSHSAAAHRLELRTASAEPSDRLCIRADREALALALRNLLDNAVKYSPASSVVSIAVEAVGGCAGIVVEDRGAGIPADEQRDIFRKFVRGTAARTLNVKGTGIGLAMVDQIVGAHGGRLELSSEPGRGSRFTILLPTVPPSATASLR